MSPGPLLVNGTRSDNLLASNKGGQPPTPYTVDSLPRSYLGSHTYYTRWILVSSRDMTTLEVTHPDVQGQFLKGNFAVKKATTHSIYAIAIDQAKMLNNAYVKGDGGVVRAL